MLPNYYSILSVPRTAGLSEIKAAFKKLALKYHPDKNPNDKTAEEIFKKINEAYQVLSDNERRKNYDVKWDYQNFSLKNEAPKPKPATKPNPNYAGNMYRPGVNHEHAQRRRAYAAPKPSPEYLRKEEGKKWLFVFTFLLVLGTGAYFFMEGMNHLAATQHYEKAVEFYQGELYKEAYMEIQEALHFKPNHSPSYALRSKIRLDMFGDQKGAIFDLGQAIKHETNPSFEWYRDRAFIYSSMEKNAEAVQDLQKALAIQPGADSLYFPMAKILAFKMGEYDQGIIWYEKILKKQPKNADVYFGIGFAKLQQKKGVEALEWLNHSLALKDQPEVHLHKGDALVLIGKQEEACKEYTQAYINEIPEANTRLKVNCTETLP